MVGDGPETWIIPSAAWLYPGLVPLASEGRTLVFFDTRARGASDPVERDEDLAFHYDVADLEALRAALEIDEAYVVGWSYLGAVAGRYAIEHPDRVEGPRSREPVGAARVDP